MANDLSRTRAERVAHRKSHQEANIFSRLAAASATSRAHAQRLLKQSSGLSIVEWRVLWDLSEAQPLSVRDFANIQRNDHSLISRALPQMQKKGYLVLSQDPNDKRQTLVTLTEKGRAAFDQAAPIMKARRDMLRATFTAEEASLFLTFIERFENSLEPSSGQKNIETE
ncbi:putative MarR-family transcriptional regulator [Sulfitobacter noctilucicola]|uniref:DNA-binding MarR family transcriptional regulator n=1 Tax=Sulfitobacter noctilucicola TaxID=1342301 RepID=A0A7W6M946_9RHOB|nr:MarR family transcriptional regulator [Sulfitobacter noctilucicola]KIN63758.1 putative MarR-family transcriptional regulator [Sulfitobacter noctilucicola]MBB4174733.1 DNA-binding MarR family transcriptional regulator [Sulfitobacter noctilucicola]